MELQDKVVEVMAMIDQDPHIQEAIDALEGAIIGGIGDKNGEFLNSFWLSLLGYVYWVGYEARIREVQATVSVKH